MAVSLPPPATTAEDPFAAAKLANRARFEEDLEFLQSLANPHFVQELAMKGILKSEEMLNYLTYLRYFQTPAYARFVRYPVSLSFLDLLITSPDLRAAMESSLLVKELSDMLFAGWVTAGGRTQKEHLEEEARKAREARVVQVVEERDDDGDDD